MARDTVRRGQAVFEAVGCAACHVARLETGAADSEALSARALEPYSDLLVHDLGETDGDVCGADVAPGEYRTPPLWGLRHRDRYMHDGLATDLPEAIRRHGGEGTASRDAFEQLAAEDRALLLRFLGSR
jgi:CxxC motif-containing protein (DUF1111 family)